MRNQIVGICCGLAGSLAVMRLAELVQWCWPVILLPLWVPAAAFATFLIVEFVRTFCEAYRKAR